MSEALRNPENNAELSKVDPEKAAERDRHAAEAREREAARAERENKFSIEAIQERIERSARSSHETLRDQYKERDHDSAIHPANKHLRKHAHTRTLKQVQRQLPKSQRAFSKFVHQPAVDAVSNVAESTVARPSGLFTGGLSSVLASLAVLYICKHYGYEYNFTIGLLSFGGGFALGIIVEGILKLFRKN